MHCSIRAYVRKKESGTDREIRMAPRKAAVLGHPPVVAG
jgi:hypothetical protein